MVKRFSLIGAIILGMCLLSTPPVFTKEKSDTAAKKKWSGRLEMGLLGISSTSNLIGVDTDGVARTSDDYKTIDDYTQNTSYTTFMSPMLLFDVNYMENERCMWYLGTPFYDDSREGLTLGMEQLFSDNSLLDISVFLGGDDLLKDPYEQGKERQTTPSQTMGLTTTLEGIAGTDFNVSYRIKNTYVDDDISGEKNMSLKRGGVNHMVKTGYNFYLTDDFNTVLTPSLIYTREVSNGMSNRNHTFGAELNLSTEKGDHAFSIAGGLNRSLYDEKHAVFGQKRKDTSYSLECFYTLKRLAGTKWYMRMGCVIYGLISNIEFFNESTIGYGVSLGYSFE